MLTRKVCFPRGDTELELWPDEGAEARYFKQFHYFERQHYCEWCWNEWIERPQPTHDVSAETECGVRCAAMNDMVAQVVATKRNHLTARPESMAVNNVRDSFLQYILLR